MTLKFLFNPDNYVKTEQVDPLSQFDIFAEFLKCYGHFGRIEKQAGNGPIRRNIQGSK